jgi:penicillin-binding protein 1A
MPVEIWSRFMRTAHQGVAVVELPGLARGGLFSGLMPSFDPPSPVTAHNTTARNMPAQSTPSQTMPTHTNQRPQADSGLDGWLVDRLFGRR